MVVSQLSYKFEELPLVQLAERIVTGLVDGEALIQYECGDDPEAWTVERIWVEASVLPKIGEKGHIVRVEVQREKSVFLLLVAQLGKVQGDHITEEVRKALENAEGAL